MVTRTSAPALRPYVDAVASAGREAVLTGAWVMAGELPAGRRRLARVGMVTAIAALEIGVNGLPQSPSVDESTGEWPRESADGVPHLTLASEEQPEDKQGQSPAAEPPRLSPAVAALGVGVTVTIMISSTLLRNRWLARLARGGHAHPYRSLALRIGAISFAGTLPARLLEVKEKASSKPSSGAGRGFGNVTGA